MEWLKELLKNAGIENVDDLESKISKEIPKHFKPANVFNALNEDLKTTQDELKRVTKEKENVEKDFSTYKESAISLDEHNQKLKDTVLENNVKILANKYEAVNVNDVAGLFLAKNKEKLTVSDDLKTIEGLEDSFNTYVKENSFYFGKNVVKGQEPDKSGMSPTTVTPQQEFAQKYKDAMESNNSVLAIQIKQEAYEKGINL